MSAQQPVQTELLMRHHQLQSRLATLKIENEEVRVDLMLKIRQTCRMCQFLFRYIRRQHTV